MSVVDKGYHCRCPMVRSIAQWLGCRSWASRPSLVYGWLCG